MKKHFLPFFEISPLLSMTAIFSMIGRLSSVFPGFPSIDRISALWSFCPSESTVSPIQASRITITKQQWKRKYKWAHGQQKETTKNINMKRRRRASTGGMGYLIAILLHKKKAIWRKNEKQKKKNSIKDRNLLKGWRIASTPCRRHLHRRGRTQQHTTKNRLLIFPFHIKHLVLVDGVQHISGRGASNIPETKNAVVRSRNEDEIAVWLPVNRSEPVSWLVETHLHNRIRYSMTKPQKAYIYCDYRTGGECHQDGRWG